MIKLNISSHQDLNPQIHRLRPRRTCRHSSKNHTATYLVCLLLAALTSSALAGPSSLAANQTSGQQASTTSPPTNTKTQTTDTKSTQTTPSNSKTTLAAVPAEQQQPQSSDVASMYVQIPVAEPSDSGSAEPASQQTISDTETVDQQKATSWKGPWPKKFQIGYIKQSDLHQVLIESLKNEPFVSLAGESGTATGSSTSAQSSSSKTSQPQTPASSKNSPKSSPSDSASLMAPNKQPATQWTNPEAGMTYGVSQAGSRIPVVMGKPASGFISPNLNQQQLMQHQYRDNNRGQFRMQRFHPMSNYASNGLHLGLPSAQQHMRPNMYDANMRGQMHSEQPYGQYHFAGFPSSLFKNQPIYTTINNGNQAHQNQHVHYDNAHHMGSAQAMSRPQKSAEYYTNWRPVTSDKDESTGAKQQQQDFSGLADGFDDSFMTPAVGKDSTSMNRHPVLNNYMSLEQQLQPQQPAGKLSPVMVANKMKQPQGAVKGATKSSSSSNKSGTKSNENSQTVGTKSVDASMSLSGARRKSQNRTTPATSTQVSITTTDLGSTTPMAASDDQATTEQASSNSTTTSTATTTTNGLPSSTMSTSTSDSSGESGTQEPDSEVIETTDTETTTSASTTIASRSGSSDATESVTSSTLSSGEQETTSGTAGSSSAGTNTDNETTTASSGEDASTSGATAGSSSRSLTREETTPSGGAQSTESVSSETKGGEIEGTSAMPSTAEPLSGSSTSGTMSDEALQAAAVRTGSEIGKTNSELQRGQQRSQVASSASKKVRSSERLLANTGRKSGNPLAAKRPQQTSRLGKQVNSNEQQATKGRSNKARSRQSLTSQPNKQLKTTGTGRASGKQPASAKSTRMAPGGQQSERLQQGPQIVSMTAAQAQSTAQTLASLLLSRCLSSTSCVHLLDICSTKQAMVPMFGSDINSEAALLASISNQTNPNAAAWSMPVGLMSSSIMSLAQTLQADRVLSLLPAWKDAIDNVVDHDTSAGYTLILPSNEAIERLPLATQTAWLAEPELLNQIIDNHIIDSSSEVIDFAASSAGSVMRLPGRGKIIKSKGLQVNQHREKMVTINGKRLVYANQLAPGK